jgi:hypothetical protein
MKSFCVARFGTEAGRARHGEARVLFQGLFFVEGKVDLKSNKLFSQNDMLTLSLHGGISDA